MTSPNSSRPEPVASRTFGRLAVEAFATRAQMGAAAASDIADALIERLKERGAVRMIFAAAPSQSEMLSNLCATPGIDWSRVTAFHMDEYIGLSPASPARFSNWLETNLFAKVGFATVHKMQPDADAAAEAVRYASLLDEAPIDFVCFGIGENGHVAFNDPPVADFDDPEDVKIVELDDVCRTQQVNDGCFPDFDAVPSRALTLTVPRLLRADRMFCVVPGATKRAAVRDTLYGPVDTACPASILRERGICTLYIDKDSNPDV